MTEVIKIEFNKIYNENCINFMKNIPSNSIDLIIADPPYYKIVKEQWDNQWECEEDYYEFCRQFITESYRILNGSMYIWSWFDRVCEIGHISKQIGFTIRNLITWNRGAGRESNNWCSAKEELLYLIKGNIPTFNLQEVLLSLDDPNRKMKRSSWQRYNYEIKGRKSFNKNKVNPSNVWFDSFVAYNSKEKVDHKTQKPISICDRIVKCSSNKDDLVYIPFAGSGSEILSCIKNRRNYIATEINELYINNLIIPRIKNL